MVQTQTSVTTNLFYDAQGSRYKRTETGQATSIYFGEWVESRGGELIRLVHGGGLDNVLAEVTATSVRRLITDAANNVIHVAEASGTTFERRYEAFGNVRNEANPLPVERGYAGRPTEGSTGLLNLRARHYDPHTGRFLQVDPIGIQSEQFYSYASSNPFVFADPLGLKSVDNAIATQASNGSVNGSFGPFRPGSRLPAGVRDIDFFGAGKGNNTPLAMHRKLCIANAQTGCGFALNPNTNQTGALPRYKTMFSFLNQTERFADDIVSASEQFDVDANLLRAVMFEENVPGILGDAIANAATYMSADFGPGTIQPMNVGNHWLESLGMVRNDLQDPSINIAAAAYILSGIQQNLPVDASISEIYTIYKGLNLTEIHQEGLRTQTLFEMFSEKE